MNFWDWGNAAFMLMINCAIGTSLREKIKDHSISKQDCGEMNFNCSSRKHWLKQSYRYQYISKSNQAWPQGQNFESVSVSIRFHFSIDCSLSAYVFNQRRVGEINIYWSTTSGLLSFKWLIITIVKLNQQNIEKLRIEKRCFTKWWTNPLLH